MTLGRQESTEVSKAKVATEPGSMGRCGFRKTVDRETINLRIGEVCRKPLHPNLTYRPGNRACLAKSAEEMVENRRPFRRLPDKVDFTRVGGRKGVTTGLAKQKREGDGRAVEGYQ